MGNAYSLKVKKVILIIFCLIVFLDRSSTDLFADNLSNKEYTIGPEDVLEIKVWDNEDLDRTVEVSQEGSITFPFIGKFNAKALSVFEIENLIKNRLADGYIVAPQVTVSIVEYQSRKVFVLGEVKRPGSYVLKRKTHILELITQAGGFTDKAGRTIKIARSKSLLQREGHVTPAGEEEHATIVTFDLDKIEVDNPYGNFYVKSGDSIYVNPVPRFFVIGEVRKPGEFNWAKGITVRQAISLAEGPTQLAAQKRIKIIRVKNGKEKKHKVGMNDLVTPGDIIKVPGSYF